MLSHCLTKGGFCLAFGLLVNSRLPLPVLREGRRDAAELLLEHAAPGTFPTAAELRLLHEHGPWQVHASEQGPILRRAGVGRFRFTDRARQISAQREPGATRATFHGAILDHVLPLALAHQGHLIAHAGTVARGGRALCLLGPSGTGKSTLTVACEAAGFDLLGDDSVRLFVDGDGMRCAPAYPGARLKPDSVAALALRGRIDAQPCGLIPKYRYRPVTTAERDLAPALPALSAIVHLERARDGADPNAIELAPVPLTEAAALLTAQCFVLDPTDIDRLRRLLAQTAATVARVPVYRLRYPSGYEHLPAVCARLAELLGAD